MKIHKKLDEWLYRKRMIQPYGLLETLSEAKYVIDPHFIVVGDYVFLDCDNEALYSYGDIEESESKKIEIEALENHVHLFEGVKKFFQKDVKNISIAIAKNLLNNLKTNFPNKKFVVLLELNYKDSVIVRFHQLRKSEEIYMDPAYFQEEYDSGLFMMFK